MALWLLCIGVLDKNASMEWTMAIVDLRRVPRILLAVLALAGPAAHAGSIDLQWDPVANATGYEVYYDTQSRRYTFTKDAGNQTDGHRGEPDRLHELLHGREGLQRLRRVGSLLERCSAGRGRR